MDLAEAHIRHRGYGGFSFRELAAEIGIKSASVHHHFPTKAAMAAAVARRYGDRFLAAVAAQPLHPISPVSQILAVLVVRSPMNMQEASRYGAGAFLTISRYR